MKNVIHLGIECFFYVLRYFRHWENLTLKGRILKVTYLYYFHNIQFLLLGYRKALLKLHLATERL